MQGNKKLSPAAFLLHARWFLVTLKTTIIIIIVKKKLFREKLLNKIRVFLERIEKDAKSDEMPYNLERLGLFKIAQLNNAREAS